MDDSEHGKEAIMKGEFFYGNDGFTNGNGNNASGKPDSSAFGKEEEQIENAEFTPHLDIHNSNSTYDQYLFYFSSRL